MLIKKIKGFFAEYNALKKSRDEKYRIACNAADKMVVELPHDWADGVDGHDLCAGAQPWCVSYIMSRPVNIFGPRKEVIARYRCRFFDEKHVCCHKNCPSYKQNKEYMDAADDYKKSCDAVSRYFFGERTK